MRDSTTVTKYQRYQTMNISHTHNWISADVQARIETPKTPLNKEDIVEEKSRKITKAKMHKNPASDTSETYKLKMAKFKNGQPEDFLSSWRTSRMWLTGQEPRQWQEESTIYVLCYMEKLYDILTNWRVKTVAQKIPTWSTSRRVYSGISPQ